MPELNADTLLVGAGEPRGARAAHDDRRAPAGRTAGRMRMAPCAAASVAMFLIGMDTLIVNVALPTIEAELGGGMAAQQWIVDGYTLPFAALLLLAGNLSDRFGAKRAFVSGTVGFALSSLVCTMAASAGMLVLGRVLLGVSAALILPSSMAVINQAYPNERDRSKALALWGIGGSSSMAVGPILGGILTPVRWSLVFAVNVPFCLLILALIAKLPTSPAASKPFDVPGQALSILGLACLTASIIEGGSLGMTALLPLGLLALGAASILGFLLVEARSEHPMMPLGLFRSMEMRTAVFGGFSMILSWNGAIFICTLVLQQVAGLDPLSSGLAFLPSAVTCSVSNILSDRLSGRFSTRTILTAGIVLLAAGYAMPIACAGSLDELSIALAISVAGLGGGLVTPTFASLVLRGSEPSQAGISSAVFNTFRQVGGAVGVAVFGALATGLGSITLGVEASFVLSLALMAVLFVLARMTK